MLRKVLNLLTYLTTQGLSLELPCLLLMNLFLWFKNLHMTCNIEVTLITSTKKTRCLCSFFMVFE